MNPLELFIQNGNVNLSSYLEYLFILAQQNAQNTLIH